eukprot:TRINITY_DN23971_c0_g1_i1.p1 TRINITY_DN23971_c0_g1~~TRINITY_DN23971_c0_g1_i1.p1  ORF type:complete len:438 (+),score=43.85 TRINITY_DN23971_c0_g1_i1:73-1386(+)
MTREDRQVLNWDDIRKNHLPSFCLPLSHIAIRSLVSPESFTEVVSNFPREKFTYQRDREELFVPMLLNQSDAGGPPLDQLRTRQHIEFTRHTLRPDDNLGVGIGMEKEPAVEIAKGRAGAELPGMIQGIAASSRRDTQLPSRSSRASQAEKPTVREVLKSVPSDTASRQSERDAGSRPSAFKSSAPEAHGHQPLVFSSSPQNLKAASEIPAARSSTPHSTARGKVGTVPAPTVQDAWCDLSGENPARSTHAGIKSKGFDEKREGKGTKPGLRVDKLKNLLAMARGFPGNGTNVVQMEKLAKHPATSAPRIKLSANSALDTAFEDIPAKETLKVTVSDAQDGGLPAEEKNNVLRAGTPFPQKPAPKSLRPAARQSKYVLQRVNSLSKKRHAPPKANGLANKVNPCVSTVARMLSEKPMLIQNLRRLGAPKMSKLRGKT